MYLPQLSPYAFHIGSFGVHWYGILMAISMLIGSYYLLHYARRHGWSENAIVNVTVWAIIGGIVGARLVFVFANDPLWIVHDPMQIIRVWDGGLAWDGGLLGGVLAGYLSARRERLPLQAVMDGAVPGLAVGYILVRIGNIFNHEVLGRFTELGFGRWPAQLVGSAIGVFLLWRYFYIDRKYRSLPPGYQFWTFNLWYQVFRALIEESVRVNPLYLVHYVNPYLGVGFLTLEQIFSPIIFLIAGVMYLRVMRGRREPAQEHPPAG